MILGFFLRGEEGSFAIQSRYIPMALGPQVRAQSLVNRQYEGRCPWSGAWLAVV